MSIETNDSLDFEVTTIRELEQNDRKTVSFILKAINKTDETVPFVDYWIKVISKSGVTYNVNIIPYDSRKNSILAHSEVEYEFYLYVEKQVSLSDLSFQMIKWDFSEINYEKVLSNKQLPPDIDVGYSQDDIARIKIGDANLQAKILKVSINKNETYYLPVIELEIKNMGTTPFKLPDMSYYLRTDDGKMFPLEVKNLDKELTLLPQVKKVGTFTTTIPVEITNQGWKIVVTNNRNIKNEVIPIPLATINVAVSQINEISVGNNYKITLKNGEYGVKLNSLQRYPWDDQDMIAANLSLSSISNKSMPIPKLGGYFILDDNIKVEAKEIKLDKVIAIAGGSDYQLQFVSLIPYTYTFTSIQFVLQEQTDNKTETDLAAFIDIIKFSHRDELMNIRHIATNESYKYNQIGQSIEIRVADVLTFRNNQDDVKVILLQIKNMESRSIVIPKLIAHLKTKNNTYLPTSILEVEDKVKPYSSALYYVSANVPGEIDDEELSLLIGEATASGVLADPSSKNQDGYVHPIFFSVPIEQEVSPNLQNIEFFPYNLSISRVGTSLNFQTLTVKVDFNYELKKQMQLSENAKKPKLTFEIVDSSERKVLTKTLALDDPKGLSLGTHQFLETFSNDKLYDDISLKTYKFNVYYELETGHRKLLASKDLKWFFYSD